MACYKGECGECADGFACRVAELGIISYKKKLLGPTELIVVMPRVRKDGACAQFRPSQPEESMIQLFKASYRVHDGLSRHGMLLSLIVSRASSLP